MHRKATCCCGSCVVEVSGEPAINAICHCGNCKKRTGSAFGWSSYFPDEQVLKKSGDFVLYEITGQNHQARWFCAACGSTLFWTSDDFPGQTGIAGGCFVDAPLPTPTLTVSNDGKCSWVGIPDSWRISL